MFFPCGRHLISQFLLHGLVLAKLVKNTTDGQRRRIMPSEDKRANEIGTGERPDIETR